MEEYHQVKHELNNKKSNKGLIAAIVIVIILAIVAVGGTWYYMNNKAKKDKKAQEEQIQQLQKQIDDLKKEKEESKIKSVSFTTKYELLKFAYENGWTISDTSTPKAANSTTDSGRDTIKLTSPNGFVVTIDAGLYGIGGACDSCTVLYSEPITVLGKQFFINYIQNTENGNGVSSVILAQKANDIFGGFNAKNIKATNGDPAIILINAKYANGNAVVVKDLNSLKTDANITAFKQLLQSLSY